MAKNLKLFFLCYPHFGTLDNWLPVLNEINDLSGNLAFTLIIPNPAIIRSFHKDNAVVKITNNIFDTVLIRAYDDIWIRHASVFDSIEWYQKNRVRLRLFDILKLLKNQRMLLHILTWPLILLKNKIFKKECELIKYKELGKDVLQTDILFYDIHVEKSCLVSDILQLFYNSNKYSLPHGLSMLGSNLNSEEKLTTLVDVSNKDNTKVYVNSEFHINFYNKKYGINVDKKHVIGIPRHDCKWIETIQNLSLKLPNQFDNDNTVVLLSRHVSNAHLLFDEKVESIKNIKKIFIDELGMKVAVKFHPKEKKERIYKNKEDDIYENIFGLDNYGLTWIYSGLHSFALCKGKKLVISLGAGVIFDMIAMGAPCIEYKNKKENEEKIMQFVKYGFVEGFSSYHELSAYVNKWKIGSNQVSTTPINTCKKYFPVFNDISRVIATEILQDNEIIDR